MASNAMSGVNRPVLKDIHIRYMDTYAENKNHRPGRQRTDTVRQIIMRRRRRTWIQATMWQTGFWRVKNLNLISRKAFFFYLDILFKL